MKIGRVRAIVIPAGGTATAKGFSSLGLPGSVVPNTISAGKCFFEVYTTGSACYGPRSHQGNVDAKSRGELFTKLWLYTLAFGPEASE